jgi:curved DNA-binding protein CbpA
MTDERDPYAILGVASDATPDAVAAAYRSLARMHHPDVSRAAGAEQRMAEINAAWTLLRDPVRRAAWDRAHATVGRSGTHPGGPGGTTRPGDAREGTTHRPVAWRRGPGGEGAAGPPPGNPRGSVLPFGRHIGWSLGEIARVDPGYLAWLEGRAEGAPYRDEIAGLLEAIRARSSEPASAQRRRGLFG